MKKTIAIFLVLTLCLCGCSEKEIISREEIVLPSIPTPMPAQNQPTMPQDTANFDDEDTEAVHPAGETHPWETEFIEAGYTVRKEDFDGGRAVTWIKGYKKGRSIVYYDNGRIDDSYYYPSGAISHNCHWDDTETLRKSETAVRGDQHVIRAQKLTQGAHVGHGAGRQDHTTAHPFSHSFLSFMASYIVT